MSQATEEFIETVDARQLQKHDWPILRLFAGSFLDRLALARYQRRLLASGRWARLRVEPRRAAEGGGAPTTFDLYGTPAEAGADASSMSRAAAKAAPTSEGAAPATARARSGSSRPIRLSSPTRRRTVRKG
jgi:hypothetical protein